MNAVVVAIALIVLAIVAIGLMGVFLVVRKIIRKEGGRWPPPEPDGPDVRPRYPLTEQERAMFWRLTEIAGEEFLVLAKVPLSVLMNSGKESTRQKMSDKFADFVICEKSFEVLVIVELDEPDEVAETDSEDLLNAARYEVIRFKDVPNVVDGANAIAAAALAGKKR